MPDLSALIREIVCNEKIYKIWGHILEGKDVESYKNCPFFKIVEYQKTFYKEKGYDPCQGGFHIGQPWNGNLKGASILFLSSNPGITLNSRCPRYHVEDKKFTWYGRDTEEVSLEGIEDFFNNRFQTEPFLPGAKKLPSLSVCIKDTKDMNGKKVVDEDAKPRPKPYGVPFWRGIRDIARDLLPEKMSISDDQDKKNYVRNVMKHVVSTEIVPFVSMGEEGVKKNEKIIDECWDSWTKKILDNSRAPVFILTGAKVKDKFLRILETHVSPEEKDIAEKAFNYDHPGIYEYRTEMHSEPRYVIAVRHPNFHGNYKLPGKFFSKETLHRLREKIADSVKNAQ